jgi:hypothetical protein
MEAMKRTIEFEMLSKLQKIWGNSHDVILGMLLWLHDLPAIPLHSVMHYCPITHSLLDSGALQSDPVCSKVLIYHKVSSCLLPAIRHIVHKACITLFSSFE